MRRKRRNHLPEFKAKVALAAIKGDRTLDRKTADEAHLKDLHAKIGELALENDFLAKALGR
jgi:transposase